MTSHFESKRREGLPAVCLTVNKSAPVTPSFFTKAFVEVACID